MGAGNFDLNAEKTEILRTVPMQIVWGETLQAKS